MNETELLNILSDWNYWGSFQEQPHARSDYLAQVEKLHSLKTATVLLGVRRAGKSSLIYLFINQEIKKAHFQTKDTLIVNFEDPPLLSAFEQRRSFQNCFSQSKSLTIRSASKFGR